MTNQEILRTAALSYEKFGISVLPLKNDKRPAINAWADYQKNKPGEAVIKNWFDGSNRSVAMIGMIAGAVSGNLEILDIDCKYDLSGSLMKDFSELVKEHLPELFPKLVIASTVNNGFHVLVKVPSESIEGNQKLASRPATEAEVEKGDKVKVLIETRGKGGYIAAFPSAGYKWLQGGAATIPTITKKNREVIFTIARSFDQTPVKATEAEQKQQKSETKRQDGDISPFDDYNDRADVPALLEKHGWTRKHQSADRIHFKRPGETDSKTSANYHTGRRIFFSFSTSTEFEAERGYNPTQVFTILETGGDYSAASKKLYEGGYGTRRTAKQAEQPRDFVSEPIPLPEDVLPAPELNARLLPDDWREWLTDIAERMQCPLDYPAVAALVSAAALIGNKIRIRPKKFDNWQVTANLWGAVVGLPSLLKSPAVNEGMFFFREIADAERTKYEKELKDADFDKEFAEVKQAELKKQMRKSGADKGLLRREFQSFEVEEPKEKRLSTTDATVEKLGELLNENEYGLLLSRDELTGWFRSLDRAGREQDRSFYLECWDGAGTFTFDRIGRGKIYIKNLTLSILGTIQPAMLEPYLRGSIEGYGDDGLVQRFQLLVYPNKPKSYTFIDRQPKGRQKARESFRKLHELNPPNVGAMQFAEEFGDGYFIQFDSQAQEFFQTWLTELENNLRSDTFETTALESHLAKYRSLMPSLALIFHLLDQVSNYQSNAVSLENARKAAAWCSYLQSHAERIYKIASLSEFDVAHEILKRIAEKKIDSEFTARDIYGKHWSKLSKPKDVQNGLDILTERGHLSSVIINEGHRPKTFYYIHESLK